MARVNELYGGGQNERLDTVEGQYDLYDQEDDDVNSGDGDFNNMNDDSSEGENDDKKKSKNMLNQSHDKLEVNLDDIPDDDYAEDLLGNYGGGKSGQSGNDDDDDKKSIFSAIDHDLFKKKESQDKGLADMETGSEVYMSELLVSLIHSFPNIRYLHFRLVLTSMTLTRWMNRMKKTCFY